MTDPTATTYIAKVTINGVTRYVQVSLVDDPALATPVNHGRVNLTQRLGDTVLAMFWQGDAGEADVVQVGQGEG